MNSDFAHLPPHIVVKILNLLSMNNFKNAVQACKQWHNVSCCTTIGRRIKIHFKGDINKSYKYINRPFSKLELTEVNLSKWNYKDFLKKFTYSIRELHVTQCVITFNKLVKCLKYLPNLETLVVDLHGNTKFKMIENSGSSLENPLSNMKVLSISCMSDQCPGLNTILSKCIKLKELTYGAVKVQNYHDNSKIYINLCNAMTKWPCVNLTSLTIENDGGNDITSFFTNFCQIDQVAIKKLNLLSIQDDYDWVEFNKFCKRLPNLEDLEMHSVDDLDLMSICESLRNLRLLCIFRFSGKQLGLLGGFQNLEVLNLIAHDEDQDQLKHLVTSNMPNLIILKLTRIKISCKILNLLCANFKNLLKLELYLNTYDCSAIFRHLHKLEILSLYFWDTSPESFDEISTEYTCLNLTKVRSLNITKYVPGFTEELINGMVSLENFDFFDDFDVTDFRNFKYDDQRRILKLLKNNL